MSSIIYKTEWMQLELEFIECLSIYIVHAYYGDWKISNIKTDLKAWKIVRDVLMGLGIKDIYTPGFNKKYCKLFGFKPTDIELLYDTGHKERLYKWVADQ